MGEPTITRKQLLAWSPCCRMPGERYCDEALDRLFAGRTELTPADTAALDIPREDVVWLWTREGALPADIRGQWIERIVSRAVETHALRCGVEVVERWAQRWLSGEDRSGAASSAAEVAAWRAKAEAEERERQVADLLMVTR